MSINISQINKGIKDPNVKKKRTMSDVLNDLSMKFGRVPLKEKLMFVQHLGVMLKAGISLSAALKTLSEQTGNKLFSRITKQLSQEVEKGVGFAECLKPHKRIFGELFISMIESGELSGKLESVLQQLFIQMKKQHELLSKVKGAITYPVVIIVAMLGIGTFMMIVVMPKITEMLKSFNAELPLPTKILINISETVSNNGIIFLIAVIAFVYAFTRILKTYKGKYYFQALLLKLPVFSGIIKKINIARFARTISSLLKTDIMIIKTFQITANVLGNLHYRKAVEEMSEKIKKGEQINEVIKKYPKLFPPVVVQMTLVGEQTGELDSILFELAEFYENEVNQIMDNLPAIIEPILILLLGVGVGAIAIAIIMPMYSLTSAI